MSEITPDQVEWAVVSRLNEMIQNPYADFNVTSTYSLFGSILCWVAQRCRSQDYADADKRVKELWIELGQQKIEDSPWRINTTKYSSFVGQDVACFLIALRDAFAHGDARKIAPANEGGQLKGFSFACEKKNGTPIGNITLTEVDMRRIGTEIATRFCLAIQPVGKSQAEDFVSGAKSLSEAA